MYLNQKTPLERFKTIFRVAKSNHKAIFKYVLSNEETQAGGAGRQREKGGSEGRVMEEAVRAKRAEQLLIQSKTDQVLRENEAIKSELKRLFRRTSEVLKRGFVTLGTKMSVQATKAEERGEPGAAVKRLGGLGLKLQLGSMPEVSPGGRRESAAK